MNKQEKINTAIRMLDTLSEAMGRYKSEDRLDAPIAINTQKLITKYELKLQKLQN